MKVISSITGLFLSLLFLLRRSVDPIRRHFSHYRQIWWIGFGFLGVQMAFTTYNRFLPLMYEVFLEDRYELIGLLMGTDNLIGLLMIPVIGAWSDRLHSPLGRRLPFILVALPVAALTFFAIPFASAILWTLIISEVVFTAAIHVYRGPIISLMPDHTPPEERSTANGIINLMGGVGTLIAFTALSLIYDVDPRLTFGIGATILLFTLVIVWWKADRYPPYVDNQSYTTQNPLRQTFQNINSILPIRVQARGKKEKEIETTPSEGETILCVHHIRVWFLRGNMGQFLILASMFCYFIGYAGLDAMFPLYGTTTLGLTEGRAGFILTSFAGSFIAFAMVAGWIGTRIGKIPTMLWGLALVPVLFLAAVPLRDPLAVAAVLVVAGFAWALVNVQGMPLIADLGGRKQIGFYVGLYYIFTMTGQMVGPYILGQAMVWMGNQGMFIAGAAVYALAFVLLQAGRARLKASPEELARQALGNSGDRGTEYASTSG